MAVEHAGPLRPAAVPGEHGAKEEAERALADRTGEVEIAEAQARLAEAAAQLRALEELRKKTKRR